jgi:hypothetical protein
MLLPTTPPSYLVVHGRVTVAPPPLREATRSRPHMRVETLIRSPADARWGRSLVAVAVDRVPNRPWRGSWPPEGTLSLIRVRLVLSPRQTQSCPPASSGTRPLSASLGARERTCPPLLPPPRKVALLELADLRVACVHRRWCRPPSSAARSSVVPRTVETGLLTISRRRTIARARGRCGTPMAPSCARRRRERRPRAGAAGGPPCRMDPGAPAVLALRSSMPSRSRVEDRSFRVRFLRRELAPRTPLLRDRADPELRPSDVQSAGPQREDQRPGWRGGRRRHAARSGNGGTRIGPGGARAVHRPLIARREEGRSVRGASQDALLPVPAGGAAGERGASGPRRSVG